MMRSIQQVIKKCKFINIILFLCSPLSADYYGQFGLAIQHPTAQVTDKAKYIEFGQQKKGKTFDRIIAIGGWQDVSLYAGTKGAAYVLTELGIETEQVGVYTNYFIGPAFISSPDSLLGSVFQVSQELGIGLKDNRGVAIGLVVKHFSNAGLTKVNLGRNWLGIKAKF